MSNASLVKDLKRLVNRHGQAQVSVWLNYKDTRSISVWIATGRIPTVRHELVKSVLNERLKK